MFTAATAWLEQNAESINEINVFPIPDGDTGTNMFLTMKATMAAAEEAPGDSVGAVAAAMAEGALMGARGNSGVILSQIIRGLATGMAGKKQVGAVEFADSLARATEAAYKAVTNPVEGTILTVCREAGEAALRSSNNPVDDITDVLEEACEAARKAVENTPALLPVLREAGVVDAGGQGLYVMFEGALSYLQGVQLSRAASHRFGSIDEQWLSQAHALHGDEEAFGYCTEFVLTGEKLSTEAIRAKLEAEGQSLLVVGDERAVQVHVHTADPGGAISYATSLGPLARVKVENMELQHQELAAQVQHIQHTGSISAVAVGVGAGIIEVLRSVGATSVVEGGQTMNPSTATILEAVEASATENVIVLPNNKNIIMAARQAAELSDKDVVVVETRSIPQGIAALLALSQDQSLEDNVRSMERAAKDVRTAEICRAVRAVKLGEVDVKEGEYITIIDGELVASSPQRDEALDEALQRTINDDASLATLYPGAEVSDEEARRAADRLGAAYGDLEFQVVRGDQPYYDYFISVE
jgi:DAK2 domain fusion protein YloV